MRTLRILSTILIALAVVFALVGPADAATKKHPKKCGNHTYKVHHPKKCGKTKAAKRKGITQPARRATRAEYNRLKVGMTEAQVKALFDAPQHFLGQEFMEILVQCPPDTKYFCLNDDGTPRNDNVVTIGSTRAYEVYTGRDKYDGTNCYNIQLKYYEDIDSVFKLRTWENWSNICSSPN